MTTQRTQIIEGFISAFQQSNLVPVNTVVRNLQLLHEINDFPFVCVLAARERRSFLGDNRRIGIIEVTVRGYVHHEDNLDKAEELAVELDSIIESFLGTCQFGVFDMRLLSLRTDEGLFQPYGILDANIEIYYQLIT